MGSYAICRTFSFLVRFDIESMRRIVREDNLLNHIILVVGELGSRAETVAAESVGPQIGSHRNRADVMSTRLELGLHWLNEKLIQKSRELRENLYCCNFAFLDNTPPTPLVALH